jgi:uncharacterized membrane protein
MFICSPLFFLKTSKINFYQYFLNIPLHKTKIFKLVLTFLMAAFMIYGGINHFLNPAMYLAFVPAFLPKMAVVYISGAVEIILGLGAIIPRFRHASCIGILVLMLVFLPIHALDVFLENPAIGSHKAALIRLPVQFLFIAWAWYISIKDKPLK